MSRDHVLHKIRTALGRSAGQSVPPPPAPVLTPPAPDLAGRIESFGHALEALAARLHVAESPGSGRAIVETILAGRSAALSRSPLLAELDLPGDRSWTDAREVAAAVDAGITAADYGLADTGTLVVFASETEGRLLSLLPPVHIAVLAKGRLLTGLDELFLLRPQPLADSSAMVLITGPSRTADIELILVRGVHGPGELHVILV